MTTKNYGRTLGLKRCLRRALQSLLGTRKWPRITIPTLSRGRLWIPVLETPFIEYAASNWSFHYASSDPEDEELSDAALKLSRKLKVLANWSRHFRKSYWGYDDLPNPLDPLTVAAYFGQTHLVRKLTLTGQFQSAWEMALTWAARTGHTNIVDLLVKLGVPCVGHLLDGRSAFPWAAARGLSEIVEMLLNREQDLINIQDADGCCPLVVAVGAQHLEITERLIDTEDTDVNLKSNDGTTAYSCAINGRGYSATELDLFLLLLRDPYVDITARNKRG